MKSQLTLGSLITQSETYKGANATEKNYKAISSIYNSIKTSFGPLGLDKMCVDASGDVIITNDGYNILRNMVVSDPAAEMLVNLALQQNNQVGDGTTSVVILAANLISNGYELIKSGVHPSVVVSGYRVAFNECVRFIKSEIALKVNEIDEDMINSIIYTSISSKIINEEREHFMNIIKHAFLAVKSGDEVMIDNINVIKSLGKSITETEFIKGYVLNAVIVSHQMKDKIESPKILCLDLSLDRAKLPLTAKIQVDNLNNLEDIRREEVELTKSKARAIIDSGANVVILTGGIDEMVTKMFVDNGIVAVRRVPKKAVEAVADGTNTVVYKSLVNENNEMIFDNLGTCDYYQRKLVGEYPLVYLSGAQSNMSTILIRGPNPQICDEIQESINDAVQILKRTLESKSIVPGGGAVEVSLTLLLEELIQNIPEADHVAVHRFSEALLQIPKLLASNAGLDANMFISMLLSKQNVCLQESLSKRSTSMPEVGCRFKFLGLDVINERISENLKEGIVEPTMTKLKSLKAATEAAISILRINEVILFPSAKKEN